MDETRYWKLCEDVLHGDQEHREWLAEAFMCAWEGRPVPSPRGSGTKDRLYQELALAQEEIRKLKNEQR